MPGPVFQNLYEIHPWMTKSRIFLGPTHSLDLQSFSIDSKWLSQAATWASEQGSSRSSSEWLTDEDKSTRRVVGSTPIEVISDGRHAFLLVNRFPYAHFDCKGAYVMVITLDYPDLNEKETHLFQTLHASEDYFELRESPDGLCLCFVCQEEGQINALRMVRSVCLKNAEADLYVEADRRSIKPEPTIQNLIDWIGVRSGETHAAELERQRKKS